MAFKSEYYQKLVINGTIEDLMDLSEQINNDTTLTEEELTWLENTIRSKLKLLNGIKIKVVNSESGTEEQPPQTMYDDFGGSAIYQGEVNIYGVKWKVYIPGAKYFDSTNKRWFYNEKIAEKLSQILLPVIPGKFKGYFGYPPWILGTSSAPTTYYIPTEDIVNMAIGRGVIRGWEYLVEAGIPKPFVERLKSSSMGNVLK